MMGEVPQRFAISQKTNSNVDKTNQIVSVVASTHVLHTVIWNIFASPNFRGFAPKT